MVLDNERQKKKKKPGLSDFRQKIGLFDEDVVDFQVVKWELWGYFLRTP